MDRRAYVSRALALVWVARSVVLTACLGVLFGLSTGAGADVGERGAVHVASATRTRSGFMAPTSDGQPDRPDYPRVDIVWDVSVPARDRAGIAPAVRAFVADHVRHVPVSRGARLRVRVASANGQLRISMV